MRILIRIKNMNITLNDKSHQTNAANLQQLAEELALPASGVAIALNSELIIREEWSTTALADGADILVITAACGG